MAHEFDKNISYYKQYYGLFLTRLKVNNLHFDHLIGFFEYDVDVQKSSKIIEYFAHISS